MNSRSFRQSYIQASQPSCYSQKGYFYPHLLPRYLLEITNMKSLIWQSIRSKSANLESVRTEAPNEKIVVR